LFLRVNLDAPALVLEVEELAFAHVPVRRDAAGNGDLAVLGIIGARLAAALGGRVAIGKGIDPFGAERRQFGFALFDQRIGLFHKFRRPPIKYRGRREIQPFAAKTCATGAPEAASELRLGRGLLETFSRAGAGEAENPNFPLNCDDGISKVRGGQSSDLVLELREP